MSEILGRNLREMEERKIFYPSASLEVLNTHEKVNMRTMLFNGEERLSPRNVQPFVKINCGLIPENLIEAELFGYEEGAFTGASKGGKKGKIEIANGGTLFLDEIGDMPLPLQIKLLDFLQDATYVKVGGTKRHKANVRIVSATNRDLRKMVEEGTFPEYHLQRNSFLQKG